MAVAEELAGSDELEELYELDASEAEPEDEEDEDFDGEDEDEDDDEDDDEGLQPEEMPHG
jgi:hypothetical protein